MSTLEQTDDGIRKAREIVEWSNNRLPRRQVSIIDRYIRGDLKIALRRSIIEKSEYGFLIEPERHQRNRNKIEESLLGSGQTHCARSNFDIDQFPMLTHDVELMQGVERFVPSIIRFQRFNLCSLDIWQPFYKFMSLIATGGEGVGAAGDWKIGVVWPTRAVAYCERRREHIQTAANGMDVHAEIDIERERQESFLRAHYDAVRNWRFRLFDAYVDVIGEPGGHPLFEGWEVGYGPIDAGLCV